ncbi:hypothetical protein BGZ94_009603 [Podila epigama]|nr:hypothetical protein BGZ94_009603 [Podila epigama]
MSMMSMPRLPLECLFSIFQALADDGDVVTLARILQTNSAMNQAALPYLYSNPFQTRFHETFGMNLVKPTTHSLLEMLIDRVNHDDNLIRGVFPPPLSAKSSVDYLANLRVLRVDHRLIRTYASTPAAIKYFEVNNLAQIYSKYGHPVGFYRSNGLGFAGQQKILCSVLFKALIWALCSPYLEQIQQLTIPLSDLARYIDVVHRLKSLTEVTFLLDEKFNYPAHEVYLLFGNDTSKALQLQQDCAATLQRMVLFVQRHTELFKGTLRFVHESQPLDERVFVPAQVELQIQSLLPVMHQPRLLDNDNWTHFVVHWDRIELDRVEKIYHTRAETWSRYFKVERPPYLPRCRNLKTLFSFSSGPTSFQWAAQEQRQRNNQINTRALTIADSESVPSPVPLYYVSLKNWAQPFGDEIDDIAFGFGQTLSYLILTENNIPTSPLMPALRVNLNMDLPCLRYIYIKSDVRSIDWGPVTLSKCLMLERIEMLDNCTTYNHQEIERVSMSLPQLRGLQLLGHSALQFHPDTLQSTANLELLHIRMSSTGAIDDVAENFFISELLPGNAQSEIGSWPMEEPIWTWDWYLPRLFSLVLSSKFAYMFQFRMLQGCPNIATIKLSISTDAGVHKRELTLSDLYRSKDQRLISEQDDITQPRLHDFLDLPTLKSLSLSGWWQISDEWFQTLLDKVAKNLAEFEGNFCRGYTYGGIVKAMKGRIFLEQVTLTDWVLESELNGLGMCRGSGSCPHKWFFGYSWGGGSTGGLGGHAPASAPKDVSTEPREVTLSTPNGDFHFV